MGKSRGGLLTAWTWAVLLVTSLLWIPAYAAMAVLWVLGFLVHGFMCLRWRAGANNWVEVPSKFDLRILHQWKPRWTFLWNNNEDGINGPHTSNSESTRRWIKRAEFWPFWRRVMSWSAWRNPVANERFLWRPIGHVTEVQWLGNSPHPYWDARATCSWGLVKVNGVYMSRHARDARGRDRFRGSWLWHFARAGARTGLWVLRLHRDCTYSQVRIGWKVVAGWRVTLDRYAGLGLQFHLRRKFPQG